jgi:hypothetical protein
MRDHPSDAAVRAFRRDRSRPAHTVLGVLVLDQVIARDHMDFIHGRRIRRRFRAKQMIRSQRASRRSVMRLSEICGGGRDGLSAR